MVNEIRTPIPMKHPKLYYIVGAILGDGHVYKHFYQIAVTSKDYDFIEALKQSFVDLDFPISIYKDRGCWKIQVNQKRLSLFFKNLTLEKLKTMLDTKEKVCNFIRGFFDAEGTAYLMKGKYPIIKIRNTNRELLQFISKLLWLLRIKVSGIYLDRRGGHGSFGKKDVFGLTICNTSHAQKFCRRINSDIKRKSKVMKLGLQTTLDGQKWGKRLVTCR